MMIDQRKWPVTSNPKTNTASSFEAKCPVCNVPRWSALERGGCGHEECPYSVKPKPDPAEQEKKWLAGFKARQDHFIKISDLLAEAKRMLGEAYTAELVRLVEELNETDGSAVRIPTSEAEAEFDVSFDSLYISLKKEGGIRVGFCHTGTEVMFTESDGPIGPDAVYIVTGIKEGKLGGYLERVA